MEKARIFAIIIILIGVVIFVAFFGLQDYKPKIESFSNVTELYSLFTPYMEDRVNSHLSAIDCESIEYYYNDSTICFVCDGLTPCFGYVLVNRTGGKRLNPKSQFLNGKYDMNTAINFYSLGITKSLNCECDIECICDNGIESKLENNTVRLIFPQNTSLQKEIEDIGRKIGIDKCDLKDVVFICGIIKFLPLSEREVRIW